MSRIQHTRRRHHGHGARSTFLIGLLVAAIVMGLAGLGVIAWVAATAASAPPLSSLKERDPGSNTEVLAADGTRLGFIQASELRQPVAGDALPKVLKDATVAIEDQRFYSHKGVDYTGLVRAAVKNIVSHKTVQGGSTLTMQLVRNLYTGERTRSGIAGYERKIKEAKLAEELENEHDKRWILDTYLNSVPYGTVGGQTAIGAQAAARIYFNKRVGQLDLPEAAMIAGLPQAPSAYSPVQSPARAQARRDEVLAKMAELGMVSPEDARKAMDKGLGLHISRYFIRRRESFFFDYIQDQLIKQYGLRTVRLGGLRVKTTIDLRKQKEARAAIAEKMGSVGPSAAVVTIDPRNGNIVAMASSADYGKSKFNLAAQGHRQPGSAFKVMALMTALRLGLDPDSTHYVSRSPTHIDVPQCGAPFDVKTYGGDSGGDMTLHRATLRSDNSVFIQLAADLGPQKIKDTARMMGITSTLRGYCAETLGGLERGVSPLEMATAYATIASGGYRNRPRAITRVIFPDGVTYEATKILEDNVKAGTGTHAQIGCPAAGKTGTTDKNTDAWFVGFTPRLATAVWVGYPTSRVQMTGLYFGRNVDGGTFPADIWGAYMKQAKGRYCGEFRQPKQPFATRPFSGHYESTGGRGTSTSPDGTPGLTTAPTAPTAPQGGGTGGTTGIPKATDKKPRTDKGSQKPKTFDPGNYASPPQGTPQTGDPAGGTAAPGQ